MWPAPCGMSRAAARLFRNTLAEQVARERVAIRLPGTRQHLALEPLCRFEGRAGFNEHGRAFGHAGHHRLGRSVACTSSTEPPVKNS